MKIAIDAGERKIIDIVAATVNSRDDVLDVKSSQWRILLPQLAVFASVAGAPRICTLIFGPISFGLGLNQPSRVLLQNSNEFVRPYITGVFGSF